MGGAVRGGAGRCGAVRGEGMQMGEGGDNECAEGNAQARAKDSRRHNQSERVSVRRHESGCNITACLLKAARTGTRCRGVRVDGLRLP
jgi:hypothetical protein